MVANAVPLAEVEKLFLAWLPEIQSRAWAINHRLSYSEREEAVAEAVAWSWVWMLAGARNARLEKMTPRTMAIFASKMFASGRRFAGSMGAGDVMSESAQASGKVAVCSLDGARADDSDSPHTLGAILTNTRHPRPDEQVRINMDFRTALRRPRLPRKGRVVFGKLVRDYGSGHVLRIAKAMNVSPGRVCQLKKCLATALTDIGYGPYTAA